MHVYNVIPLMYNFSWHDDIMCLQVNNNWAIIMAVKGVTTACGTSKNIRAPYNF